MAQRISHAVNAFNEIPGPPCYPIFGKKYKLVCKCITHDKVDLSLLVGSLLQYKLGVLDHTKYHKVLHHLNQLYGPLVREKFGNKTRVHVFNLDDIKEVNIMCKTHFQGHLVYHQMSSKCHLRCAKNYMRFFAYSP